MAIAIKKINGINVNNIKKLNGVNYTEELYNTSFISSANLIAYYRAENVNDSKGAYTLTNTNSVGFSPAKFNNGFDFGSTNTNKVMIISNNLGITGGAMSISLWVKLNVEVSADLAFDRYTFCGQNDATSDTSQGIWYEYNSGTPRLFFYRIKQGVANQGDYYNITMGTSDWYHIVYTYDGTNIRGYVNGVLVLGATAASGNGTAATTSTVTIGSNVSYSSASNSIIDDVAIFNTALSAANIISLSNYNIKKFMGVSNV